MTFDHFPAGVAGLLTGLGVLLVCWTVALCRIGEGPFAFDPPGGNFEPRLVNYLRLTEVLIGLATGSVVLLVSLLKEAGGSRWRFGSPLVLLGLSVVFGLGFMGLLVLFYEGYLHNRLSYTRLRYVSVNALAFASLISFGIAYVWLGFAVGMS